MEQNPAPARLKFNENVTSTYRQYENSQIENT